MFLMFGSVLPLSKAGFIVVSGNFTAVASLTTGFVYKAGMTVAVSPFDAGPKAVEGA